MSGPTARPIAERFMSHVREDEATGCWLWTASTNWAGYGRMVVGSRTTGRRAVGAHRLSHELFIGPIPEGADVCHRCDTPSCVNPSHLFAGTKRENMQDMVAKGRQRKPVRTVCRHGHHVAPGAICLECQRLNSRRHYHRNLEQERARARELYWADPAKYRAKSLERYHRSKQP